MYFFEVEKTDDKEILSKYPDAKIFREALSEKNIKQCSDAEVICVMVHSVVSEKIIISFKNLKLIVTRSVGYDHIDLKRIKRHGIPVCNVPDYWSHVIAEHVFALLLASVRNVLEWEYRTEHDNFSWKWLRWMALKWKTLAVIGTGKIGAHVCRIASIWFKMNVIAYDKYPNKQLSEDYNFEYKNSLDEIWKEADIISLHTPLFPETEHMINKKSISKMKDWVVLINTARGGLINTPDLIEAIKSKKISHAALDVIEHENNIKEDAELLHLPWVIITPHIAFYADDSIHKMYDEAICSIERFINNETLIHQIK